MVGMGIHSNHAKKLKRKILGTVKRVKKLVCILGVIIKLDDRASDVTETIWLFWQVVAIACFT